MATKCSHLVCAVHREQKLILACIGWSAGIQPDSTLVGSLPVCDLARMPQCVTPLAIVHDRPAATPESAAFVDKTVDRMMRGASYDTTAVRRPEYKLRVARHQGATALAGGVLH